MNEKTGSVPTALQEDGTITKVIGYRAERKLVMLNINHKIGTDTVAGKICDVWKMDDEKTDMRTYVYKGMVVKK